MNAENTPLKISVKEGLATENMRLKSRLRECPKTVSPSSVTPNPPHLWPQNTPDFPSSCDTIFPSSVTQSGFGLGLCPFLFLLVRFGRWMAQILQNGACGCGPARPTEILSWLRRIRKEDKSSTKSNNTHLAGREICTSYISFFEHVRLPSLWSRNVHMHVYWHIYIYRAIMHSVNTHCDQPTPVSALEFVCRAISFSTPTARMRHQWLHCNVFMEISASQPRGFPYLSIYPSMYLSIYPSIHPSIYLFLVTFWLPIFSGKKSRRRPHIWKTSPWGYGSRVSQLDLNMTSSIFLTINPPSYTWDSPYFPQKISKSFIVSPPNIPKSPVFCSTQRRFQAATRNHNQAIRNIFGLFAAALKDVGRSDNKTSQ